MDTFYKTPIITASKMAIAAALAFFIYNLLHLEFGYWSVITIAAITQAGLSKTLTKSLMRCLGTIVGALIGYLLALVAHGNIEIILILFFIAIVISSYIAIQPGAINYAGVITGLTTVIVLSASLVHGQLFATAVYRSSEVMLGIIIMAILNIALWIFVREPHESFYDFIDELKNIPNSLANIVFTRTNTIASIKIALACLFTFAIWIYFRQLNGFWATVSCLLIMEESVGKTQTKSILRFWAHVAAALFGALCALLIGSHFWWLILPLTLSFFVCGFYIGRQDKQASLGNTAGIAIAVMLLASPGTDSSLAIITSRFLNVMFGIGVAILVTRYFWPNKSPTL